MKSLIIQGIWVMGLAAFLYGTPVCAQRLPTNNDYAFSAEKRIFHVVGDDQPVQAADMDLKPAALRKITPAQPHPAEVAASNRAYTDGRYTDAATAVAEVAKLEPADPTVLYCYARALYRGPGTRPLSYPVYQRLVSLLDAYGRESATITTVYLHFFEAYFKLATLQLDEEHWAAASYNLSRASMAMGAMPTIGANNPGMREQILQYQTECFAHLNNAALCRYFGQRTLQFYPENQYVKPYLAALPRPASRGRR